MGWKIGKSPFQIMDGSSIDAAHSCLLKLAPNAKVLSVSRRNSMRLRAILLVLIAALIAVVGALYWANRETDVTAKLAERTNTVGETVTPEQSDEPADPCFDAKGTVKDVLDGCAAFIASGTTDKKKLVTAHSIRAMAFSATGNLDAALVEMNAAVEINPERANSYFMRAAGYDAKKDYDKALADLDTAIGMNDKDGDYYLLRGEVYSHKGDFDKALADLNEKVKLDPEATSGYSHRGQIYRQRNEYDLAIADYTEVIKLDSRDVKGHVDRGWIYVLKDDLDNAAIDFDNALKLQENNASALVGRGVVKSRKGQPTDGASDLALAKRLEPGIFDEIKKLGVK
ncbi:MAG: tetratricopeptide repeat protein [Alphaproteobacteria bacterium]|nr:tetratricopeptide repeat protein [Alphaproteobacteria bacterium]